MSLPQTYGFAETVLEHFQLSAYFSMVCGSELDGSRSAKTEIIQHVLDTCRIHTSEAVMIGDRKHDLIGARNCGIHSLRRVWVWFRRGAGGMRAHLLF